MLATIFHIALDAAQRVGDHEGTAVAHLGLGGAYLLIIRHDEARTHLRHALECYERLDDRTHLAVVHHNLAVMQVKLQQGHAADALAHARQALDLFQATGNPLGQAYAPGQQPT